MTSHPFPSQQEPCAPPPPNWLQLPDDVSSSIIRRLDVVEILTSVQYVCSQWRRICRDPSMWTSIDFAWYDGSSADHTKLYQLAVDLSSGGLVDAKLDFQENDVLLRYITDRSKHVRRVHIGIWPIFSEIKVIEVLEKFPLLEELHVSLGLSSEDVAIVGRLCPLLHTFNFTDFFGAENPGFAIAESMPGLRHLCILGGNLTSAGLIAILDGCQYLESLNLRGCHFLKLDDDLKARCSEQIKDFQGPDYAALDRLVEALKLFESDDEML